MRVDTSLGGFGDSGVFLPVLHFSFAHNIASNPEHPQTLNIPS